MVTGVHRHRPWTRFAHRNLFAHRMLNGTRVCRIATVLALSLTPAGCIHRTWHTPEEVRAAFGEAAIIGASPDQAIAVLRKVRLRNGDSIQVGAFEPDRHRIEASVSPGKRTWFTRWAIDVTVKFDSTAKATNLEIAYSAINPM